MVTADNARRLKALVELHTLRIRVVLIYLNCCGGDNGIVRRKGVWQSHQLPTLGLSITPKGLSAGRSATDCERLIVICD